MTLAKASLIPKDKGLPNLEFMFNPTELTFEKVVETSENKGARSQDKGQPKVGFANTNPYKVTINKILFDTYETGEDVVKQYLDPFRKAVQFADQPAGLGVAKGGADKKERTPLYTFVWGSNTHLRCCFVEKLTYKLTMFLPDGTPVRAIIDSLTLKEADEPKPDNPTQVTQPSQATRQQDTAASRQKKRPVTPQQRRSDRQQPQRRG